MFASVFLNYMLNLNELKLFKINYKDRKLISELKQKYYRQRLIFY